MTEVHEMLQRTQMHLDLCDNKEQKHSLRIGKRVPDGAVNLAYYHNRKADTKDSVLISRAPKQTVDHVKAQQFVERSGLPSQNANAFPSHVVYQDDKGYIGHLQLNSITWEGVTETDEKMKEQTVKGVVQVQQIPDTIYCEDGEYSGNLFLQQSSFNPTRYANKEVKTTLHKDEQRKMFKYNLEEPASEWPDLYTLPNGSTAIEIDGFKGTLAKVPGQDKYNKTSVQSIGQAVVKTKVVNNLMKLPDTFVEDGVVYRLKDVDTTRGKNKFYGIVRFWGNFYEASDVNGVYGDPQPLGSPYYSENTYVIDKYGIEHWGRGHFAENAPRPIPGIWRADRPAVFIENVFEDNFNMPDRDSLQFDIEINEEFWMLDTKYSQTGLVWADKWIKDGKQFPPPGYEPVGSNGHMTLNTSQTPNLNRLNAGPFNDPHGRKGYHLNGTTVGNAQIMQGKSWFRDAIVFYHTGVEAFKGYYVGHVPDGSRDAWNGEQLYKGLLSKEQVTIESTPIEWQYTANYAGKIKYNYTTYTGIAHYTGVVAKQLTDGNIEPLYRSEYLLTANEDGILCNGSEMMELESERFFITQEFENGKPLYYRGRLSYPIYIKEPPGPFEHFKSDSIQLFGPSMNPLSSSYLYHFKAVPYGKNKEGLYWIYVYTNFETTHDYKVTVVYNACDTQSGQRFNTLVNQKEELFTRPFYIPHYNYELVESTTESDRFGIRIYDVDSLRDDRQLIPIRFKIKCLAFKNDGQQQSYETTEYSAVIINKKYAFSNELKQFKGEAQIISPTHEGRYQTAFDLIVSQNTSALQTFTEAELQSAHYSVTLTDIKVGRSVECYIADGCGLVLAETAEDTGFYNEETGLYDRVIKVDSKYEVKNGQLVPVYSVKCRDIRSIELEAPRIKTPLEDWHPLIEYGRHSQVIDINGTKTKLTYLLPEFKEQFYSKIYGRPYIDIKQERANVVDDKIIKTNFTPIMVIEDDNFDLVNLSVYKVGVNDKKIPLSVRGWNGSDGHIYLNEVVSENDHILIDYTYEEQYYTYRGYHDGNTFVDLDLNPGQYHTFYDTRQWPSKRSQVYDLFNSIIYFFVKPAIIQPLDFEGQPVPNKATYHTEVIYHKFNDSQPDNASTDLMIGSIYVRHNASLQSVTLVDTRQLGGGLIEKMNDDLRRSLEPESDYYWDIGYWDGKPYSENAVVIVRLDKRLLVENGGQFTPEQVQDIVNRWMAAGVIPIVEYVSSFGIEDSPNSSLKVQSSIVNQTSHQPVLDVKAEEKSQFSRE